ncbi:MAG: HDIG domain-containing protein [Muribaculaceae bacterium]|nr:HDIG domain-containing protein [Muribaculaceae bacterium]
MKKIKKFHLIRIALLFGAVALILFVLPREDHQSYIYELNQPWRYQLLTADFNVPIRPDSGSTQKMQDSIERNFIPFVRYDETTATQNIDKFKKAIEGKIPPAEITRFTSLLDAVYKRGLVTSDTYQHIRGLRPPKVRLLKEIKGSNVAETIDASAMFSPSKAYDFIDSAYNISIGEPQSRPLEAEVAKALNVCLVPNYDDDTEADGKYRAEEFTVIAGALGVIKPGQRIVDRGEIITPQIFTNLNTYMELLAQKNHDTEVSNTYFYLGQGLYIAIWFVLLYFFLANYRPEFYKSNKRMIFLISFITLFVIFDILVFEFFANGTYLIPFAAVPITVMIFFDSRSAIFTLLTTVMISALVAIFPLLFIFLELFVGLVATYSLRQLSQRSQLLRTALFTFICYVVGYLVMCLVTDGDLSQFSWRFIGVFAVNAVMLSFAYILILIVERLFGFTSTVTLVELSDINNRILRRLAEDAPGTFQHSMQVSTLASEAARAIGANTQLVRTGALYHDIGKMESPVFFTENQHGVNPHKGLNPETSAQKIISHVTGGVALANKWKLPAVIRDFITEHHGKGVTKYFYNTAVNESNGEPVDRSRFEYPGPNPRSKETAIVMMADAVEAASRSLQDYTSESINSLVDKIIDGQAAEGNFKDSPISYRDVEKVKETFKKRLATIYHSRIAYPELHAKDTPALENPEDKKTPN